jgi:hypothetical protein
MEWNGMESWNHGIMESWNHGMEKESKYQRIETEYA